MSKIRESIVASKILWIPNLNQSKVGRPMKTQLLIGAPGLPGAPRHQTLIDKTLGFMAVTAFAHLTKKYQTD